MPRGQGLQDRGGHPGERQVGARKSGRDRGRSRIHQKQDRSQRELQRMGELRPTRGRQKKSLAVPRPYKRPGYKSTMVRQIGSQAMYGTNPISQWNESNGTNPMERTPALSRDILHSRLAAIRLGPFRRVYVTPALRPICPCRSTTTKNSGWKVSQSGAIHRMQNTPNAGATGRPEIVRDGRACDHGTNSKLHYRRTAVPGSEHT